MQHCNAYVLPWGASTSMCSSAASAFVPLGGSTTTAAMAESTAYSGLPVLWVLCMV